MGGEQLAGAVATLGTADFTQWAQSAFPVSIFGSAGGKKRHHWRFIIGNMTYMFSAAPTFPRRGRKVKFHFRNDGFSNLWTQQSCLRVN